MSLTAAVRQSVIYPCAAGGVDLLMIRFISRTTDVWDIPVNTQWWISFAGKCYGIDIPWEQRCTQTQVCSVDSVHKNYRNVAYSRDLDSTDQLR